MASESDKPFVCTFEGCSQKFSNNDHLSVHRQKHEFSLKFGASRGGDSMLVDQTPTPTRFLRSVEESGLFQELAENPFDQDFQKAPSSASSKHPTEGGGEKEEASLLSKPRVSESAVVSSISTIPIAPPPTLANPDKPVPLATAPSHISSAASAIAKQKLLQNIQLKVQNDQMKEQQKLIEAHLLSMATQQVAHSSQGPDILQALKAVQESSGVDLQSGKSATSSAVFAAPTGIPDHLTNSLGVTRKRRGRKPDDEDPEIKRQKFLERNRAAASRCRAKKKVWVDNLEKKSKDIEGLNQALQQEVVSLRSEVQQLKSILIAHKDCPLIVHQAVGASGTRDREGGGGDGGMVTTEVTLLSQLAAMPSMSPLISSPVPSVGSVVPNISHTATPTTIIFTSNGAASSTPEVAKDVEISAEAVSEQ